MQEKNDQINISYFYNMQISPKTTHEKLKKIKKFTFIANYFIHAISSDENLF